MYRSVVENLRLDFFMQANNIRSDLLNIVCIKGYLRIHCKFGNFRETFIFANSVKIRICDAENSRKRCDLPISVNDRMISPIHEDFILHKTSHMRSFTKIKSSRKFPNLQ